MKNKKNNSSAGTKWVIAIFVLVLFSSIFITELMSADEGKLSGINVALFTSEISGTDQKLVLLTQNDCTKCDDMSKALEEVKAQGITVYSINVDDLSDSDMSTLLASSDLISKDKFPAVVHISSGAIVGSYTGEADATKILDFTNILTKISASDFASILAKDEESYIYIGRPTCPHCVASMPALMRIVATTGKNIYYINIDNETSEGLAALAEQTNNIYDGGTPLFMVVKGGNILRNHAGEYPYADLNAFFSGANE